MTKHRMKQRKEKIRTRILHLFRLYKNTEISYFVFFVGSTYKNNRLVGMVAKIQAWTCLARDDDDNVE